MNLNRYTAFLFLLSGVLIPCLGLATPLLLEDLTIPIDTPTPAGLSSLETSLAQGALDNAAIETDSDSNVDDNTESHPSKWSQVFQKNIEKNDVLKNEDKPKEKSNLSSMGTSLQESAVIEQVHSSEQETVVMERFYLSEITLGTGLYKHISPFVEDPELRKFVKELKRQFFTNASPFNRSATELNLNQNGYRRYDKQPERVTRNKVKSDFDIDDFLELLKPFIYGMIGIVFFIALIRLILKLNTRQKGNNSINNFQ